MTHDYVTDSSDWISILQLPNYMNMDLGRL